MDPVTLSAQWTDDRIVLKVTDPDNKQVVETIPYSEKPVFGTKVIERSTLITALRELADLLDGKQP